MAPQHGIEQSEPDLKHSGAHIAGLFVNGKRVSVIAAFMQDRIAPETGDFRLMHGPVGDMDRKHRAKAGVVTDGVVKRRHHRIDFGGGDGKAWGKGVCHGANVRLVPRRGKRRDRRTPPLTFAAPNPIRRAMSRIFLPLHRIIGPAS